METLKKRYLSLANLLTSLSKNNLLLYLLVGLILIGFGVLSYKTNIFSGGDKVEVLNASTQRQDKSFDVVVEIAGAVEKPGVYKLVENSRVDDLLIISGGLSENADREWLEKNINKAAKLSDGQKIYIYKKDEIDYQSNSVSAKENSGIKLYQVVLGTQSGDLVNINTSSQSELEELDGIGPVYGQKIIEHRPYSTLEELVSKGAISQKVFEKIKNSISL